MRLGGIYEKLAGLQAIGTDPLAATLGHSRAWLAMIGICAITIGLLLDPLMQEFGWKNGVASSLATVYSLSAMVGSPVVGWILDRFGSKHVMIAGVGITAAGFVTLASSTALPSFYAAFVMIGFGYGCAFFLAIQTLIARRMGDEKNLGMGIFAGVGSIGAAIFSLTLGSAITHLGWRTTTYAIAILFAALIFIVVRYIPAAPKAEKIAGLAEPVVTRNALPLRLIASPYFVLAVLVSALASFGMTSIYFHVVPILLKTGLSNDHAHAVFGATWLLAGLGSFCLGAVAQRLGARTVLAASLLCCATGTACLLFIDDGLIGFLAVALFILLWGTTANAVNQFIPIVLVDGLGPEHLGVLVGIQSALMGIVGSFAPILTGILYDQNAGYAVPVMTSACTTLIAFSLAVSLAWRSRHRARSDMPA